MDFTSQGIPIIDLNQSLTSITPTDTLSLITDHVIKAIQDVGSFYIKNHGIDSSVIDSAFDELRSFFGQPIQYKMSHALMHNHARGYIPFETQNVNAFMGRQNKPNDPLERLVFGPIRAYSPEIPDNIWPRKPATFESSVSEMYSKIENFAHILLRVFANALETEREYFSENCVHGQHIMKANFYPASQPKPMQDARFAEHTDGTLFTILAMDDNRGSLKVRKNNGEWVDADPVAGAFFVNLGDAMQVLTNGHWPVTVHKVCWPQQGHIRDRLSVAFFVSMNSEAIMRPVDSCVGEDEMSSFDDNVLTYSQFFAKNMSRLSFQYRENA